MTCTAMKWTTIVVLAAVAAMVGLACPCAGATAEPTSTSGLSDGEVVTRLMAQPEKPVPGGGEAPPMSEPQVTEAIIHTTPAELWKVWTTADGFRLLGVANCDVDFRVGGLIRSSYAGTVDLDSEGAIHNQIIAYEPYRMVAFRIAKPPKGFPFMNAYKNTWSVVTMTDLGDGRTHLRLAGMGYGDEEESRKMRDFFTTGNDWTLKKLQSHFDPKLKPGSSALAHAERPLDPIDVSAIVPGARADVFEAYTTSAGWKAFMGVEAKVEARPGGPFELYFSMTPPEGQRGSEGCTVLSLVPGEMITYTWNAPPAMPKQRAERTWVVVMFEEVSGRATRVRARHLGFAENAAVQKGGATAEEWAQTRAYFANAWPRVLGALSAHFEKQGRP